MTVIIRKIRTALQREYLKSGGIQIQAAIDQAEENLGTLADPSFDQIDQTIDLIAQITADPRRRPTTNELLRIHALVNVMLGACAATNTPGLVDTLYAVARLVAGLLENDTWLDGTLTPAVNLLRLVRRGVLNPDEVEVLIVGIDQCTDRISHHHQLVNGS
jgi:glutamine synthetase adenylyltransferase